MKGFSNHVSFLQLTRYTLIVVLLCYLPQFFYSPSLIALLVIGSVIYKLIADYLNFLPLPIWIKFIFVIGALSLLKIQYGNVLNNGFFIGFLATFIGLKCLEIHNYRDIKFLIICNFYLILTSLIINQSLWIIIYLFIAILANLLVMLKLNSQHVALKGLSFKSIKYLLVAVPFSLLLFYIFPRIANPLWQVPTQSLEQIGFSEKMSPGSITQLFNNDRTAMRITFSDQPVLDGYWQGLVLNHYNGVSWSAVSTGQKDLRAITTLNANQKIDYEVMLEPHHKKWLFYLGFPVAARPKLLFIANSGLVTARQEPVHQRLIYSLKTEQWPYQPLSELELGQNLKLPLNVNNQLIVWARDNFTHLKENPAQIIKNLHEYISQQPFYYTLAPNKLNSRNQMDEFWFQSRRGYCEHYASAIAIILRAVGIPTRVIIGYQGGIWNSVGRYLDIQQNHAHAWLEYWQENLGWQRVDPTRFIASKRIDKAIYGLQLSSLSQRNNNYSANLPWLQRTKFFIETFRFFTERWLLFYNYGTQQDLLKKLGLEQWNTSDLLRAAIVSFLSFVMLTGCMYIWNHRQRVTPLLKAYQKLQKEFKRFNIPINPAMTLQKQCRILIIKLPHLAREISSFLVNYEQIRLKQIESYSKNNQRKTISLFKKLSKILSKNAK